MGERYMLYLGHFLLIELYKLCELCLGSRSRIRWWQLEVLRMCLGSCKRTHLCGFGGLVCELVCMMLWMHESGVLVPFMHGICRD